MNRYYSLDGATWTQAGSTTVAMTSTALAGLAVTAHNNAALCLAAFDSAATAPHAPPTGLFAAANYSQITLAWNPTPWATSYNLARAPANASPYTNLLNLAATSFADTNAANGTTYYYEVSAVNPIGASASSAPVSARLPLPALSAALASNYFILSWPVTASSFSLFSATNLVAPVAWTAVTNAMAATNGQVTATLSPSDRPIFYCLISK